jgi:RNA polymerase sigma-70 factor (ECF subfamily)
LKDLLEDHGDSPFDSLAHEEVRARVEEELRKIAEPFRTTVILRDIEDLSYEEIAEVTQASLGTVKSRLTRGREMLKKRLQAYVNEVGAELGLGTSNQPAQRSGAKAMPELRRAKVEVTS